jgi:hypothetical protein
MKPPILPGGQGQDVSAETFEAFVNGRTSLRDLPQYRPSDIFGCRIEEESTICLP